MFQNAMSSQVVTQVRADGWPDDRQQHAASALESLLLRWPPRVHRLEPRQALFHAGQPRHSLYYVRSGCFKTSVLSEDGREKITGFRMRGDLLGLDSVDMPAPVSTRTCGSRSMPTTRLRACTGSVGVTVSATTRSMERIALRCAICTAGSENSISETALRRSCGAACACAGARGSSPASPSP